VAYWSVVSSATLLVLCSAALLAAYYHSGRGARLVWSYEMYRAEVLQDLGPPDSELYQKWSSHYEKERARHQLALAVLDKGRYAALAAGIAFLLSLVMTRFASAAKAGRKRPSPGAGLAPATAAHPPGLFVLVSRFFTILMRNLREEHGRKSS